MKRSGPWVGRQGYTLAGLPREVYVTMPRMLHTDEEKLVIEIQYPIQHEGS